MAPDQKAKRAQRPPSPKREIVDQKVIKALAHPVRAQALAILNERVASPNEIAQELDQGVGHISYHINVLKDCECIELVETVPRRGAVEHFYRATTRAFLGDEDWRRLPPSVRPTLSATLMQDLVDDAAASLSAGTFDARDDRHFSWAPMIVDEQGWAEVVEVYRSALGRVLEIQAASADRLTRKEESGIPISVAAMVYETPGR